jgi:hypothetical protein
MELIDNTLDYIVYFGDIGDNPIYPEVEII